MSVNFLLFLAGLAALLAGIWLLPQGLETLGQARVRAALTRFTATPVAGFLTGTLITALVQSSSAVTVLAVGLASKGLLSLPQGIAVVLGANVGTTVTGQLMAFDVAPLIPWLVGLGLAGWCSPFPKARAGSQSILGLGLIFGGLHWMEGAFAPWRHSAALQGWLALIGDHYVLALLTGIVVTGILQSSSAVTGLTMVLGEKGFLSLPGAVAIILGSNLGSCITALLAACTGTIDARRLALSHLVLNATGIVLFFPFLDFFACVLTFTAEDLPRQIANAHTIYNTICSLLALPFVEEFAHLLRRLLPES